MHLEILDIVRACRRSRVKVRVYDALLKLKVATLGELADSAHATPRRVEAVLYGDLPNYRRDTALIQLRVAEERETAAGPAFAITIRGAEAHGDVRQRLRG